MAQKNDAVVKSIVERKFFSYKKGGLPLDFNLRVDNSSELRPFRDMLYEAIRDIDEILKGMKN